MRQQLAAQEQTAAQLRQAKEDAETAALEMRRQLEAAQAAAAAAKEQAVKASRQADSIEAYKQQLTEVRGAGFKPAAASALAAFWPGRSGQARLAAHAALLIPSPSAWLPTRRPRQSQTRPAPSYSRGAWSVRT